MKVQSKVSGWSLGIAALLCCAATPGLAQANAWTPAPAAMNSHRDAHTALNLNGTLYLIGGRTNPNGGTTRATETYNGLFTIAPSMQRDRSFFPAVPLGTSGKVLTPGGYSSLYGTIAVAELFDSVNNTWVSTGAMRYARELFTGTELPNGQVLVAGGFSNNAILGSAELYTPSTGTFALTAAMAETRHGHTATLLASGKYPGRVLVTGGRTANNISLKGVEIYTPAAIGAPSWTRGGTTANNLQVDRFRHTATTLLDGRILFTGGYSSSLGNTVASAEIYDPATDVFTLLPASMSESRMDHSATLLNDGRVLIAGGWNSYKGSTTASVEIFDPVRNRFSQGPSLPVTRHEHAASLLGDGSVLVTGGLRWDAVHDTLNDAQIYTPPTGPDFTVGVDPSSQSVNQGVAASYPVYVAATGGFTGGVSWDVTGLPPGAVASFGPDSETTLVVTTAGDTPTGTYPITISATNGSLTRTAAATLVVTRPDFTLSAAASTVTVNSGSSATDSLTIAAKNGFNSDVTFDVTGLPAGATATFSPATVTGAGSTVMTIAAGTATPAGTYSITLTATGGGVAHSLTLSLVVATPDFSITMSPTSRSVRRGYSTTYGVTIASTGGSTEAVNLTVTGLPSGVTGRFSPAQATSTSTLTVTTVPTSPRGTYTLTITGTGATSGRKHTKTVTLSITN